MMDTLFGLGEVLIFLGFVVTIVIWKTYRYVEDEKNGK